MSNPKDLRYTKEHEWARVADDGSVLVGITAHACEQLGDIVYVELPTVGTDVDQEGEFGTVESVKAVSELYAPIGGKVVEINEKLEDSPELVGDSPYTDGWLIRLAPRDPSQLDGLMDVDAYEALIEAEG